MQISHIGSFGYMPNIQKTQPKQTKQTTQNFMQTQVMQTSETFEKPHALYSSAATSGQTIRIAYDKNSSPDDPVMLVWGEYKDGTEYNEKIHLKDVNIYHASIIEMLSFRTYHQYQNSLNNIEEDSPFIEPLEFLDGDIMHDKYNFAAMYEQTAKTLCNAGYTEFGNQYWNELHAFTNYLQSLEKQNFEQLLDISSNIKNSRTIVYDNI